jgi:hypothetical protein
MSSLASPAASPAPLRHDAEVIGLVGLAHGTSHFFHLMLPPLFPWLMRDFSLSYTEAGLLMTVFFVVSGIGQALAGFVVDRIGARPVLFFGIGTLSLSGVLVGLAGSYAMLFVAAAVAGLGNSIFHPADFTLLNKRVSQAARTRLSVTDCPAPGWAAAPLHGWNRRSPVGRRPASRQRRLVSRPGHVWLRRCWGVEPRRWCTGGRSPRTRPEASSRSCRRAPSGSVSGSSSLPPPHSGSCRTTRRPSSAMSRHFASTRNGRTAYPPAARPARSKEVRGCRNERNDRVIAIAFRWRR